LKFQAIAEKTAKILSGIRFLPQRVRQNNSKSYTTRHAASAVQCRDSRRSLEFQVRRTVDTARWCCSARRQRSAPYSCLFSWSSAAWQCACQTTFAAHLSESCPSCVPTSCRRMAASRGQCSRSRPCHSETR